MNSLNNTHGVSTILGTILLLFIAIGVMAVIYFNVLSIPGPESQKFVNIIGTVEGTNLILEHRGGEEIEINNIDLQISFLDTIIPINLEKNLSLEARMDGVWNLGERIVIPFPLDLITYKDYGNIISEVIATDQDENEMIFLGDLSLNIVSDVGINIMVNDTSPTLYDNVSFIISVKNFDGIVNAENVTVFFNLPNSFLYISHNSEQGSYDPNTGLWNIGSIQLYNDFLELEISAMYVGADELWNFTQLCLLVDGSGSIRSSDWNIMRTGLSQVLQDSTIFPHDGSVELSVIQFAQNSAFLEIDPTIITSSNYDNVAQLIVTLDQRKGGTPLACGLKKAADTIHDSIDFDITQRQVVNIITDGMPNKDCGGDNYSGSDVSYDEGKTCAVEMRNYLISHCPMTEEVDEIDSLAIGNLSGYYTQGPDVDWLNSSIIWPEPGCIAPPFDAGRSWVMEVSSWEDFYIAIKEMFQILFNGIWITCEIEESYPVDPYDGNNRNQVLIIPVDN